MNPEQWTAAQALFDELCDLPATERERRLTAAGDGAVAGAVRRMLAGDERGEGVLERGPSAGAESLLVELAAAPEDEEASIDARSSAQEEERPGLAPRDRLGPGPWSSG